MEATNRKLIRPPLNEVKQPKGSASSARRPAAAAKKTIPPEQTNAENFYYAKQMQAKTPMVVVLKDGEELHGVIEWYDKHCLKITREDAPNALVYKANIKYLYKAV